MEKLTLGIMLLRTMMPFSYLSFFWKISLPYSFGIYTIALRGDISSKIILASVIITGLRLCINLIPVSAIRPWYLIYQNPGKLKIQILEYVQSGIEFVARTTLLVLFVYATRPWGAWIVFIVKTSFIFHIMTERDSGFALENLCGKIGYIIRSCFLSCVWGITTSFYIKFYAFIYPEEIIRRCKQLSNIYDTHLVRMINGSYLL